MAAKKSKCKIEIYTTKGKQPWHWQLISANNRVIARSDEGYSKKSNLMRALATVQAGIGNCDMYIEE